MNPTHFLAITRVETRKLFAHPAGRLGIVLALAFGVVGPLAMMWIGTSNATLNGAPLGESMELTAPMGILWTLGMRDGSQLVRLFILALGALSLAGEFRAKTLREALLRPVPRWVVPVAKFLALSVWTLATSLGTWTVASLLGAVLCGVEGSWGEALWALLVSTAGDLGMAAVVLLLATLTRSVPASLVLAIVLSLFNWFTRGAMYIVEQIAKEIGRPGIADLIGTLRPWTPTYAYDGWTAEVLPYIGMGDDWYKPWITLIVLSTVSIALSSWRLSRLDVH